LNDELVIDAWGGLTDRDNRRKVDGDTLFNIWSVAKGDRSGAARSAERGLVDYERTGGEYWRSLPRMEKTVERFATH